MKYQCSHIWKPIESAPKNIEIILYLCTGDMRIARWAGDHWSAANEWIGRDLPTHWMLKPETPAATND